MCVSSVNCCTILVVKDPYNFSIIGLPSPCVPLCPSKYFPCCCCCHFSESSARRWLACLEPCSGCQMVELASSLIINDGFYTCSFQLHNEGFNLSPLQCLISKNILLENENYIHIWYMVLIYDIWSFHKLVKLRLTNVIVSISEDWVSQDHPGGEDCWGILLGIMQATQWM